MTLLVSDELLTSPWATSIRYSILILLLWKNVNHFTTVHTVTGFVTVELQTRRVRAYLCPEVFKPSLLRAVQNQELAW